MKKWEYRSVMSPSERDLKEYGELGWELVAIDNSYNRAWFWLKRPVTG